MFNALKDNNVLKQMMIDNILKVKENETIHRRLTALQNEITVSFDTKVIAVTSVHNDELAAAFGKAFAHSYALNKEKTLVIDANLYNPSLAKLLTKKEESDVEVGSSEKEENYEVIFIDEGIDAVCLNKEVYPSEVYKNGLINKIIKDNEAKYDHFVVLVPSLKKHKEVSLLKGLVNAIILVSQSSLTKKGDIYYALQYLVENKLPIAKTVIIK